MFSSKFFRTNRKNRTANKTNRRRRLHRNLEQLESRQLLASLAGEVWADTNGDGIRGSDESGAIDARVYIDVNDDQHFNPIEPFTRTDSLGQYAFEQVAAGSHVVRVELLPGQTQSSPQSYFGTTQSTVNNAVESRLFEMNGAGAVSFSGVASQTPIDGLVETNAGVLIGVDSQTDTLYQIDKATGAASQIAVAGVDLQAGLAHDPETDTIFATALVNGSLQLTVIDGASGQLSEPVPNVPNVLAINFGSTFYEFNPATGSAVELARQTLSPFASTLDARSDGAVFGLQGSALNQYSFPVEGSTATTLSTLSQSMEAISFGANDQLFGVSTNPSAFHQIDPATGAVTNDIPILLNGISISGVTGFDIAPDGTHYIVDSTRVYTFNPATGVATQLTDRSLPPSSPIFTSLSVAENGDIFASLFSGQTPVAQINPVTGQGVLLGNNPLGGSSFASLVATGLISTAAGLNSASASDLTFDSDSGRIVGFDDATDRFFQFDTAGKGQYLATASRALNADSLAFNGSSFVMFDADDPAGTALLEVNPDTGVIKPLLQSSDSVTSTALAFSDRSTAHRVSVTASQTIAGLGFGLRGNVNQPPFGSGLFINELVIDPLFGDKDSQQAVEIRGKANSTIPAGTYFVIVGEDGFQIGEIHGIFDLSNLQIGSNGFLVLLSGGSPFTTAPGATVLKSTTAGFGSLPGNIYSDTHSLSDRIDFIVGNNSYMLIQSDVAPPLGGDIDANDDGIADPNGILDNWNIQDSIAMHPLSIGDSTYSDILFAHNTTAIPAGFVKPEGTEVVLTEGSGYAARVGDSLGSSPDDWIVGTVRNELSQGAVRLGLEDGIFGVPNHLAFQGRDLDHFGESNFVGGVRGTVALSPLVNGDPISDPAAGVQVLADTNGNQRQDVLSYVLDPDNYAIDEHLINTLPGVTLNSASADGSIVGFAVAPEAESFFNQNGNRVFASAGIPWFASSGPLRADFYRPARSVSIDGIGTNSATFIRLDAYDVNGNVIGTTTSRNLVGSARERLTISFRDDVIAYAMAYSADSIVDANGNTISGSPFGKLDRFAYTQGEAMTTSDKFGRYEISNLFPDNYQISFLNAPGNRNLIGAQSVPITIQRYENFILGPNLIPTTADLAITIEENTPAGTRLGAVTGADNDGEVTFSIISGAESGIQINSVSGALTVGPSAVLDFETNPTIALQVGVTDSLGATAISNVNLQLTDVNESPVVQESRIVVAEDATVGSSVGRIRATDPDTRPNDRLLTYSLVGGTGAAFYSVNPSNGIVTLMNAAGANFESAPQLTLLITVSDNGNPAQSVSYTQIIAISDANDPPQLVIPNLAISENATGVVGSIGVLDEDLNQTHFYQIDGGSGASIFEIRPNGDLVLRQGAKLDFETQPSLQLNVTVLDNGVPALTDTGVVNISILDVNEPAVVNVVTPVVGENAQPGDVVSRVDLTDDEGMVGNYTIAIADELDGGLFELRPITSQVAGVTQLELVVKAGAQFDFETRRSATVVFLIDDLTGGSPSSRVETTISVLNQNDAPTVRTTTLSVSEGAQPGSSTQLAKIRFSDVDLNETFTARIIGGTGASQFVLDPNTHILTLAAGANLDADVADPTLTLQVEVTDSGGLTGTGTILIRINNVNEAPVFSQSSLSIPATSGQLLNHVFGSDLVTDPENGDFQLSVFDSTGRLPSWVEFNPVTRTLTAVPSLANVSQQLTLRAFELGSTIFNDLQFTIDVQRGSLPFTNERNSRDVDNNKRVAPSDVLIVINFLSDFGETNVSAVVGFPGFVDVSGNGRITPDDILLVIEALAEQIVRAAQREAIGLMDLNHEKDVDEALLQLEESSLF